MAYIKTSVRGVTRIHKESCTRASGESVAATEAHILVTAGKAMLATCCRPNRDSVKRAALEEKVDKRESEVEAAERVIAEARAGKSPIKVHAHEVKRQVEAERAAKGEKKRPGRSLRSADARYAEAISEKRKGGRGKGRKVTDEELAHFIQETLIQHPDTTPTVELEIAYWVEHLSISRPRWNAAWEKASAGRVTRKAS